MSKSTNKAACRRSDGRVIAVREAFSMSRSMEYLNETELTKQIGYPWHVWLEILLKELLDNSLDHCEEIGKLPVVVVTLKNGSLAVRDNGDGIPPEVVDRMPDFDNRTSSREAYRCPTRGAQGNAGKVIIGAPFVLNNMLRGDKPGRVVIESCGIRHEISVAVDTLTQLPRIEHRRSEQKVQNGTFVEVLLPCILGTALVHRFVLFCRDYSLLNPHLTLRLELPGDECHEWLPSCKTCPKWTAAEPDPAGWHDITSFERLAAGLIVKDRNAGQDRPLRDFIKRFSGLSRSDSLKLVMDEAGFTRCNLSELVSGESLDRNKTSRLLAAAQKHGKTPKPGRLGCIGKPHVIAAFTRLGATRIEYKKLGGAQGNLPYVVEAAFAELPDGRTIVSGCNFSPVLETLVVPQVERLLVRQMVTDESSVAVLLHITTVAPKFRDDGKSELLVAGELEAAIMDCMTAVTAKFCQQRKRDERRAGTRERRHPRQTRPACTLKNAVKAVLPDAVAQVSVGGKCDFHNRDLYYAARKLIQTHTSEELDQKYFDRVLDELEMEQGLIEGRQRDPRGFLLEPHTGKRIPLGTKAVDGYDIPPWLYHTIIYVEKKGMLSKFELGKIGERYDCAIIAAEGYATTAAKSLLDAAQRGRRIKVLCFHDADPHGYNIARTLSESTGAHTYDIEVIDAGLHLEEALAMGLPTRISPVARSCPKI
jgi:hypothetical protein